MLEIMKKIIANLNLKLLDHWLVKDKLSKSFLLFKINEIKAAPFGPPYLQI
jgi:hypothetical protein